MQREALRFEARFIDIAANEAFIDDEAQDDVEDSADEEEGFSHDGDESRESSYHTSALINTAMQDSDEDDDDEDDSDDEK